MKSPKGEAIARLMKHLHKSEADRAKPPEQAANAEVGEHGGSDMDEEHLEALQGVCDSPAEEKDEE